MGRADEEARCKGLETYGGMPLGSHSLPICFTVFGHGLPVLVNEPIKHVDKDRVWVLHSNWLIRFMNCLGEICNEDIGQGRIHGNDISSGFSVLDVGSLQAIMLVVRSAACEVRDGVNFGWKQKKLVG